jgi:hypothetical protein
MEELELYPGVHPLKATRAAFASLRAHWKRALSISLVTLLIFGVAGYHWITTATPMDRTHAVELFRAEKADAASSDDSGTHVRSSNRRTRNRHSSTGTRAGGTGQRSTRVAAAPATRTQTQTQSTKHRTTASSSQAGFQTPKEGVYSWATDGYEQVSGARRDFPKESQRIITVTGDNHWTVHHYFSEQREIWTYFQWGSRGAEIAQQRNKVTFGPVTNDSTIDFSPPMLVAPRDLKVGYEWGDTFDGKTHGDYSSRIFEHTTMDIGGQTVEVWGMAYVINLHGDQEGQVNAKVWLAPDYALTVQEHYVQDVTSSGAKYHAEWTQQLKSLQPQQ